MKKMEKYKMVSKGDILWFHYGPGQPSLSPNFWVWIYVLVQGLKDFLTKIPYVYCMTKIFQKFIFKVCAVNQYNQNYIFVLLYILNWFLTS